MRIGINGYYLTTPSSGIGQYSFNLLSALAAIDKRILTMFLSPADSLGITRQF